MKFRIYPEFTVFDPENLGLHPWNSECFGAPRFGHTAPLQQRPTALGSRHRSRPSAQPGLLAGFARPRLAIGDGGELHADGEVARDLKNRQKSQWKSHGIAKYNFKVARNFTTFTTASHCVSCGIPRCFLSKAEQLTSLKSTGKNGLLEEGDHAWKHHPTGDI